MVPLLHTAETLAKPGLGISKEQNPGIQHNKAPPCPKIPGWEHFNHPNVPRSQDNNLDKMATGITCKSCKSPLVPSNYKAKKTSPKPALQISTGQSPEIRGNQTPICPGITVNETLAKPGSGLSKEQNSGIPYPVIPRQEDFNHPNVPRIRGNPNSPCPVIPGQEKSAYGSVPRPKVNNSLEKINYIKVA